MHILVVVRLYNSFDEKYYFFFLLGVKVSTSNPSERNV